MSYLDDSIIDIKQLSFARGDRAIFDGVDIRIPGEGDCGHGPQWYR